MDRRRDFVNRESNIRPRQREESPLMTESGMQRFGINRCCADNCKLPWTITNSEL